MPPGKCIQGGEVERTRVGHACVVDDRDGAVATHAGSLAFRAYCILAADRVGEPGRANVVEDLRPNMHPRAVNRGIPQAGVRPADYACDLVALLQFGPVGSGQSMSPAFLHVESACAQPKLPVE